MSIRYESAPVAIADLALAAWYGLKRQPLARPHACNECGRTVTSVPASRTVTSKGALCRRVRWSLRLCPGSLTKATTPVSDSRNFHLGDILSVTTGRFLCPAGVDGLYDLLGFMTGETLFTHQLPRASRQCEQPLKDQLPALAGIVVPDDLDGKEAYEAWLADQVQTFGEYHPVTPLPEADVRRVNPVAELAEMMNRQQGGAS